MKAFRRLSKTACALALCPLASAGDARGEVVPTATVTVNVPRTTPAADTMTARWLHGTSDGRLGWYVARIDPATGKAWVFAVDQPSGRKEPSYRHRAAGATVPLDTFAPQRPGRPAGGPVPNYGVTLGKIAHVSGGEVITNDAKFGATMLEDSPPIAPKTPAASSGTLPPHSHDAGGPCPPDGPCPRRPNRPEPEPEPEPDAPAGGARGLDSIRPYFVPGALLLALLAVATQLRKRDATP